MMSVVNITHTARIHDSFEQVDISTRATTIPGVFYILEITRHGSLNDASFIADPPDDGSIITIGWCHFVVFTERSSSQKMLMELSPSYVSSLGEFRKFEDVIELFKTPVEDINTVKSLLEFM